MRINISPQSRDQCEIAKVCHYNFHCHLAPLLRCEISPETRWRFFTVAGQFAFFFFTDWIVQSLLIMKEEEEGSQNRQHLFLSWDVCKIILSENNTCFIGLNKALMSFYCRTPCWSVVQQYFRGFFYIILESLLIMVMSFTWWKNFVSTNIFNRTNQIMFNTDSCCYCYCDSRICKINIILMIFKDNLPPRSILTTIRWWLNLNTSHIITMPNLKPNYVHA